MRRKIHNIRAYNKYEIYIYVMRRNNRCLKMKFLFLFHLQNVENLEKFIYLF